MNKVLLKESIGEFFSKMYETNAGKRIEVSLRLDDNRIAIYYKDKGSFDYIALVEKETVDGLVESLSK